MANNLTIPDQYRTKFAKKWDHAFEQQIERVRPYMSIYDPKEPVINGDGYEIPSMGTLDVTEYAGRSQKMTSVEPATGKTTVRPRQFYAYTEISPYDQIMLKDLEYGLSVIQKKQAHAAARFLDQVALGTKYDKEKKVYELKKEGTDPGFTGGILNVRYSGNGGLTKSELDLTVASYKEGKGNLIPVDYATSGTGVSNNYAGTLMDRVEYGKRRLEELDVFDGTNPGEVCLVISPAVRQMLKALEVKLNRDYGFKDLGGEGTATFCKDLNMTIIVSNMLPLFDTQKADANGTAVKGARMCAMWLKSRVTFMSWRRTEWTVKQVNDDAEIDEGIRVRGMVGASRLDDESVFVLPVVEQK